LVEASISSHLLDEVTWATENVLGIGLASSYHRFASGTGGAQVASKEVVTSNKLRRRAFLESLGLEAISRVNLRLGKSTFKELGGLFGRRLFPLGETPVGAGVGKRDRCFPGSVDDGRSFDGAGLDNGLCNRPFIGRSAALRRREERKVSKDAESPTGKALTSIRRGRGSLNTARKQTMQVPLALVVPNVSRR
jgi:hypothetical protein